MGKNTPIEWTDHSWPVINGCRRVSEGCRECYAERLTATRLSKTPKYEGLAVFGKHGPRWTGEARLWEKHLDMPLRLRKPSKIFVCDMGDLFYEKVPDEWIAAVFGVMAAAPQHQFQVLTKRAARMRDWFRWAADADAVGDGVNACLTEAFGHPGVNEFLTRHDSDEGDDPGEYDHLIDDPPEWPLPNVHLGVSCEDQATADQRIPDLLATPAVIRWVSAEPLLGPVDLAPFLGTGTCDECTCEAKGQERFLAHWPLDSSGIRRCHCGSSAVLEEPGLSWCVIGGESGPGARPFHLAWGRSIIEQCKAAETPVFFKQMGSRPFTECEGVSYPVPLQFKDRKGGDWNEFPDVLRVREFPR